MTKEEILKLHELVSTNIYGWLNRNRIIKQVPDSHESNVPGASAYYRWESLAECAFRLRDETFDSKYKIAEWYDAWVEFEDTIDLRCDCEDAKPIHWIQAALLAKLEQE